MSEFRAFHPIQVAVLAAAWMYTPFALAAHGHWGYGEDASGPRHWGELSTEFERCGDGVNQSPIDIAATISAVLWPIQFEYKSASERILNNGHTIEVEISPGSGITVEHHHFSLKQFHFHTPSENTVEGKSFPLEAHFVHADEQGNLAVVSVLFAEGKANAMIDTLWQRMPEEAGQSDELSLTQEDWTKLLPADKQYYRFNGSLTTPPCSEGVRWLLLKSHPQVSQAQAARLLKVLGHPNNRPVQARNARVVLE